MGHCPYSQKQRRTKDQRPLNHELNCRSQDTMEDNYWKNRMVEELSTQEISKIEQEEMYDIPLPETKWSLIKILLKFVAPLYQSKIACYPRNWKTIKVWHDNIMGRPPLNHIQNSIPLQQWMEDQGIKSLNDIFVCNDSNDKWTSCKIFNIQQNLSPLLNELHVSLAGCTVINNHAN